MSRNTIPDGSYSGKYLQGNMRMKALISWDYLKILTRISLKRELKSFLVHAWQNLINVYK